MKKILIALLFLLSATTLWAENGILKNLAELESLSADFVQTNSYYSGGKTSAPIIDTYSGNVNVVMKKIALFEYSEPFVSWYLLTGPSVEAYDSITEQLIKYKNGFGEGNVFLKVLTDFSAISDLFHIDNASTGDSLMLKPKNDMGIKYLQVKVDGKGVIASMKTEDNMGNATELAFKNVKLNSKIAETLFKKEIPKGTIVIEK